MKSYQPPAAYIDQLPATSHQLPISAMSQQILPGVAELEGRIADLEAKVEMLLQLFDGEFTKLRRQVEVQAQLIDLHMKWSREVESRIKLLELKESEKQ